MSSNKKLFIQTLGCQMNDTDSQHIQAELEKHKGYTATNNIEDADLTLGIIHATQNRRFTKSYKTGFTEYNKSSYNVVYLKHKDPRDIGLEIPILRFEVKLTTSNTYKFRKRWQIINIDESNIKYFFDLGKARLRALVAKYDMKQLPESYCSKHASVRSKRIHMYLQLFGSLEAVRDMGMISDRTYYNYKKDGYNTMAVIPPRYDSIPFKFKLKLDFFLRTYCKISY